MTQKIDIMFLAKNKQTNKVNAMTQDLGESQMKC